MLDDVQAVWAEYYEIQVIKGSLVPKTLQWQLDAMKADTPRLLRLPPRHLRTLAPNFAAIQNEVILRL